MKLRASTVLSLTLFAVLGVTTASASLLYDNGFSGEVDAWNISDPYSVTNSFEKQNDWNITGIDFVIWAPFDPMTSVDWSITSDKFGGTTFASGTVSPTNTFLYTNGIGIDLYRESFVTNISLGAGTFWLQLQNAQTAGGNPIYWDESGGPSDAYQFDGADISHLSDLGGGSQAFAVSGVPEPASFGLLGTGFAALGLVLRRRNRR